MEIHISMKNISIVIPIYNEAGNLDELFEHLENTLNQEKISYEIIAVNDGSRDDTWKRLEFHANRNPQIRAINFQRNYGQTAAISAGITHSAGDVVIPMDADLENDPADIPRLLSKLNEGYDVVSGWRQNRWQNQILSRKIPSILANKLISVVSGVPLSDFGCTLKAYRREVLNGLNLYGDMHRFMAAHAVWNHNAKVTEIPVAYTPRKQGVSNYGLNRSWKVLLDLLTMKFMTGYASRPIHFFGLVGFISIMLGVISGAVAVYLRFSVKYHATIIQTPLPTIMAMFITVGVMLILMGLLAEILMRTYHESRGKPTYTIKEKIN